MTVDVMLLDPAVHSEMYLGGYVRGEALVAMARKSRRPYQLHLDVLTAMGCRPDVRGATTRRGPGRELDLISAWTYAHEFAHIYVCHADYVTDPRWFSTLAEALARAGASTHLVCDSTTGATLCDWADSEGHPILTDPPRLPRADEHPDAASVGDYPQMLPEADFYLWLARCRDLLAPHDFRTVRPLHEGVWRLVPRPPRAGADARRRLVGVVQDHPSQGEVVTCVRAAQAACFRHGLLLRLKLPHLLATVQDGEARRLAPAEVRALHAYYDPWVACGVVLRDAGHDYRIAGSLRVSGVDETGRLTSTQLSGDPLGEDARLYMRAQRFLRVSDGAAPADPLFTRSVRDVAEAIRWARMDLNLPESSALAEVKRPRG
ncbi:MAG: hypothetical protein HZY73_07825 [Micropruina sp.]|nr:MAG: hypothetical protein HZY73_07825 [Micropruina sp.]